jgi:cobalt-zinc-cadmium efflux system membrane fusion protein
MKLPSNKQQWLPALIVAVLGLCLAVLLLVKPVTPAAPQEAPVPAPAQPDTVALSDGQLARQNIALHVAGPATIDAITTLSGVIGLNQDKTAHVVPRLAGVVEAVHADLGQHVKKGKLLVVISSPALAEQRSALFTAQNRLALASTTFEREKKLWQERISAEQDYLQARQAMQEAQIEQRNAREKLSAFGVPASAAGALNSYQLRAPFDGVIVAKHVVTGEAVKEDANIFTVADLSSVWADIAVPASQLAAVRVGANATVRAGSSSKPVEGKITHVGDLLGEQSRTAMARVVLANPDGAWRPGLFVSVDVGTDSARAALAVPVDAIHTVEDEPTVFVRIRDGFAVRHIVTGKRDARMVEVVEGLKAGEQVAAGGSFLIEAELGKPGAAHGH